jgi:GNAT superfamily N-acetyltransferase
MSANRITAKDLSPPKILDQNDDVSSFSCGVKDMDEFIQKEALDFQKERLGVTYLFMHNQEFVGFATLSMADLKREKMEAKHRPQSKVENYPALLIGQLAVCEELQGQDVGTFICDFCFDRALRFSKIIGCRFMFVNAIESALGFYLKYGFVLLPKQEGREQKVMFLDISKATEPLTK